MTFENVVKSWFTTLLGIAIMVVALYSWYNDQLSDYQALGAGIVGFAMMWMRDIISRKLVEFFSVIIEKFKSKPQ
jgi:hypothetical protein